MSASSAASRSPKVLDRPLPRGKHEVRAPLPDAAAVCGREGSAGAHRTRGFPHCDHHPPQVGQSAFAFLFSEFIQYSQARVSTADELQQK